jgi:methyl-accepting chemotaxis protein
MNNQKVLDLSLAGALLLIAIGGIFFLFQYEKRVDTEAKTHLTTMLMLRQSVLASHFESLRSEVRLWSDQAIVTDLLKGLLISNQEGGVDALDQFGSQATEEIDRQGTRQRGEAETIDDSVRAFVEHHAYYDVFLIDRDGNILYTMAKEGDLHTNLQTGPYANTGLGRLYQRLASSSSSGQIAFEDFSAYAPSNDAPAAFLGAPVVVDDEMIGVYAIQIPVAEVNAIMQFSSGMGETGETYLVGGDRLMRSDSRFLSESAVLVTEVNGETTINALRGESGIEIVDDYRGVPVYSAYRDFAFEGTRWAVLAEQDVEEVRQPVVQARWWLGGAFLLLCFVAVVMRFAGSSLMVPAAIAGLLGLAAIQHTDDSG